MTDLDRLRATLRAALRVVDVVVDDPLSDQRLVNALCVVLDEYGRATRRHGAMRGPHEGYAVILEEMDELWDDVKRNDPEAAAGEAVQVTAMGLRFLVDVCGDHVKPMLERNSGRGKES